MILAEILADKKKELTRRRAKIALSTLRAKAKAQPKPLSFVDALRGDQTSLIAEIKRASPSRGELAPQLDPVELALTYAEHGASVISVLTDEKFFHGALADLTAVKQALLRASWEIPVLRKDFILSPYQVYEARAAGADAVLLIVALLSDALLASLLAATDQLGMTALVEVHDEPEVERALRLHPQVIGINRRDLRDFHVDPDAFARLRPLLPPELLVVAESGVHNGADVEQLRKMGADAVLVGEALVSATDVAAKVEELCAGGTG